MAHAQQTSNLPFFKYKLGDIEVISLSDGFIEAQHRTGYITNANIEQTKTALRAAGLSDAHLPVPFTVIALKMRNQLVLIDSGNGGPVGPRTGLLKQSMAAAGLDPKAVSAVLITHCHGDHIGGLMDKETNAQVFPDAEIIVPAADLKWWSQPEVDAMDLGPTRVGLGRRIRATLAQWKNVMRVEGESEVLPNVRTILAYGHSPGHVVYSVSSGGKQLFVTGDVSLLPALFLKNPDWHVNLDQDPVMATDARRKIFDRAVSENAMVTGTHWLMPGIGTVAKDGNGFAFTPVAA
jgi:glyoxylase-like metal-dependent hydrolase (beta-lactamase superfamily II)